MEQEPKTQSDMHIVGALFGATLVEEEYEHAGKKMSHTLVHLYVEDDGYFHETAVFDSLWLRDLSEVVEKLIARAPLPEKTNPVRDV